MAAQLDAQLAQRFSDLGEHSEPVHFTVGRRKRLAGRALRPDRLRASRHGWRIGRAGPGPPASE
jgi:hypothetical protein